MTMSEGDSQTGVLQREAYFPTLIFFKDLTDAEPLNTQLLDLISQERAKDQVGLHRSNVKQTGAWHSQDDINRRPEFSSLVESILHTTQQAFDDLEYDPQLEPQVDNMWINVSPRHAFNRMHVHPGVIWSGVYYVQAPPNSGRIYFSDPRAQAMVLRPGLGEAGRERPENWSEVFYEPIAGRIILFPAWLLHEVEPNLCELPGDAGNRISISFNLRQRARAAQ